MPGGSASSARPPASKRSVSTRDFPSCSSVMASARGSSALVQRHTNGSPLGVSRVTGTARSLLPAPRSPSNQSTNPATRPRYASSDAPPRNAQRHKPAALTVAVRLPPPRSSSVTMGRGTPRRASRAVSATAALESRGFGIPAAVAGGGESHTIPDSVPASGDAGGRSTYQSPAWPSVDHTSLAGPPLRPRALLESRYGRARLGSPVSTTRRAPWAARVNSPAVTGASVAPSRQRPGSASTKTFTGTRATSVSERARNRISQSGGAAKITAAGWRLTSIANNRVLSRGSVSSSALRRTSSTDQPEDGIRETGNVRSVEIVPLSGSVTASEITR